QKYEEAAGTQLKFRYSDKAEAIEEISMAHRHKEALEAIDALIAAEPEDGRNHFLRASILYKLDLYDEAIKALKKCLKMKAFDADYIKLEIDRLKELKSIRFGDGTD
ncbi:MAG: hypothetical protein AAF570_18150, partial [Bacteroidota bacterium]